MNKVELRERCESHLTSQASNEAFNRISVDESFGDDFLDFIRVEDLLWELEQRPQMTAHLGSWKVWLRSPVANDIHEQDRPDFSDAAVEECSREESNGVHEIFWALG